MKKSGAAKEPSFFWQGLLIVLPVLVLALFGIYSLKLERQRAEQEAAEQAQRFAEEFADLYERDLTNSAGQETIFFEMDAKGNLLSPVPYKPIPDPQPLDLSRLSSEQTILWQQATRYQEASNLVWGWQQFLGTKPPPQFAALAWYNLGLAYRTNAQKESIRKLLAKDGEGGAYVGYYVILDCVCPQAADAFAKVMEQFPEALGESGLPLLPLAQLHYIENITAAQRQTNLIQFVSNALSHPSLLMPELMQAVKKLESPISSSARPSPTDRDPQLFKDSLPPKNLVPVRQMEAPLWPQVLPSEMLQSAWERQEKARGLYRLFQNTSSNASTLPRFFWLQMDEPVLDVSAGEVRSLVNAPLSPQHSPAWLAQRIDAGLNRVKIFCIKKPYNSWFGPLMPLLEQSRLPNYAGVTFEVVGRSLGEGNYRYLYRFTGRPATHKVDVAPVRNKNLMAFALTTTNRPKAPEHPGARAAQRGWVMEPYMIPPKSLASARRVENGVEYLRVNVRLVNPAILYQQTRTRMLWLGLLIGTAAFAAFMGWLAAWRAFQRQHLLAVMKTNFVSSVSHELRAPIASVRLLAEGLERGKVQEPAKQQEYFRFIVQECRRLTSLVENALDFSRIEQGRKEYEFESTDLKALVEQTARLLEPSAEERQIRIERKLPNEAVSGDVDGRAIQQALVNLIDNALKHSPNGAVVEISLEVLAISNQSSTINLSVQDHGPGIPPEEHERIFERFYRRGSELRRETQGVGIGLSIVKHIVEAHGGRVLVDSAVGNGSRFTIALPNKTSESKNETADGIR